MNYRSFRNCLIARGYSTIDVMDCIRDYFVSDAVDVDHSSAFNRWIGILHGDFLTNKKHHYDVDDSFSFLLDKYCTRENYNGALNFCVDDLCYDLWTFIYLGDPKLDDYWQDILKDC